MENPGRLALKVGALGILALTSAFVVIVILGSEGSFFSRTRRYHVAFRDVAGLREGAQVRLGGRRVGEVDDVAFGPLGDTAHTLIVTFNVQTRFADRLRLDSLARISSQGLLGDKLLEVSIGSAAVPELPDGGWLPGEPSSDPARLFVALTDVAERARNVLARLDDATRGLDARGSLDELHATLASARRVMERVEAGPGSAHDLIYDPRVAGDARRAVAALERASDEAERAMAGARAVTEAVNPAQVRQVTNDIASLVADVRAGKGSLGGLLVDPTLYEETKRILVNIRRNAVLKAVARFVISEDMPDKVMDSRPDEVQVHPRPGPAAAPTTTATPTTPAPTKKR